MTTSIIARVMNDWFQSNLLLQLPCSARRLELMENSEKCSVCLWNIFSDGLLTINPANVVI